MLVSVRALYTAIIFFGTFIVIGWLGKLALNRWMAKRGATLSEINEQAGPSAGKGRRLLLGFWRNES
jgi:hypothetical protein